MAIADYYARGTITLGNEERIGEEGVLALLGGGYDACLEKRKNVGPERSLVAGRKKDGMTNRSFEIFETPQR